jgi:hypothetical protein
MSDKKYFAEGLSVFCRSGNSPIVEREIIGTLVSHRFAKMVANCLNLYNRSSRFAAKVTAAEKGEQNNGVHESRKSNGLG